MVLRVCRRILRNEHDAEDVCQAVFLVLARRSGQVRWHACIANWLYGVAVRVAQHENRRMSKHRQQRLIEVGEVAAAEGEPRESEQTLYEELQQLPNKYRAPVILCHLEGKTRQQAAAELGVNETTVKGRLERGREMLRGRLSRRGLAAPAALFSGALAAEIAGAAVSESMITATAQAAAQFAAGATVAGASANAAVAIAKGELGKMLLAAQIKWAAITVATVSAVGTGTVLVTHGIGAGNGVAAAASDDSSTTTPPVRGPLASADEAAAEKPDGPEKPDPDAINGGKVSYALKMFGLGMHNYHGDNNAFPSAASYDANQKKLLSWRVHLLPYLDEGALYRKFHLNEPWDSPHNKPLVEQMPEIFSAGNDKLQQAGKTIFLVPVGEGTVFGSRDPVAIRDIKDGTSNTIMVLTVKPKYAVEWTKPAEWELDEKQPFEKLTGKDGMHFRFGLCDGSAHNRPKPMTLETLKALLSHSGGEIVQF